MQVNLDKLIHNTIAVFMIMIGLVTSEYVVEKRANKFVGIFGAAIFILGWYNFLSVQSHAAAIRGALIPLIAFTGQIYFSYILNKRRSTRRKLLPVTVIFWLTFMASWASYIHTAADTTASMIFLVGGLAVLAMGMMGYFFIREKNWNELTGGLIPRLNLDLGIFNPFLPMVGFSWALIGLGSSLA